MPPTSTQRQSLLDTPIEYLKGVGPKRAKYLREELEISTFNDLLHHYPFRYVDRTEFHQVKEVNPGLSHVQLKGLLRNVRKVGGGRNKRMVAYLQDDTGMIELVWFRGLKWLKKSLKEGKEYVVFGKPSVFKRKMNLVHPDMELASKFNPEYGAVLQPHYHTTEKLKSKGLNSRNLMKLQQKLQDKLKPKHITENLPGYVLKQYRLPNRYKALRNIHFPKNKRERSQARKRLKFEELLLIQVRLLRLKTERQTTHKGLIFETLSKNFNTFYEKILPFELTGAQKRVLREFRQDFLSGKQMNRLLQGDVGSGKTVVALMAMLMAIDNGYQAALMAPTEILAHQHYQTLSEMVEELEVTVGLLTSSVTGTQREDLLEKADSGELDILVGTHALIQDEVRFDNLGFVVVDEQHRFGVAQRGKLWKKNNQPPHVLVMSATPIPRTLAMTLYGDLDVSVIDEMPPGRKPVKTAHRAEDSRLRVFGFIKEQIAEGNQAFMVYPLIEESQKLDYKNLQEGIEVIEREFPPPEYQVSIIHGRMSAENKDQEMERFIRHETQIMVATNVIEVGVDIPNANVMVIESAERFGLSQLHQLRGRVGRSEDQAYCILMTGDDISENARKRMSAMVETTDGFKIAEVDMKLRGPGDIEGTQQSGMVPLRLADLVRDGALLEKARECAQRILAEDPELKSQPHEPLRDYLEWYYETHPDWSEIA